MTWGSSCTPSKALCSVASVMPAVRALVRKASIQRVKSGSTVAAGLWVDWTVDASGGFVDLGGAEAQPKSVANSNTGTNLPQGKARRMESCIFRFSPA
jgi:hypothetical protein